MDVEEKRKNDKNGDALVALLASPNYFLFRHYYHHPTDQSISS